MAWMTPLLASTSAMHDSGLVELHAVGKINRHIFALHRRDRTVGQVSRHDGACDHVVGEDRREGLFVLREQEAVDETRRECCERIVGRSEDRERAFARQRLAETGCGDCSDERVERAVRDCDVDDVCRLPRCSVMASVVSVIASVVSVTASVAAGASVDELSSLESDPQALRAIRPAMAPTATRRVEVRFM